MMESTAGQARVNLHWSVPVCLSYCPSLGSTGLVSCHFPLVSTQYRAAARGQVQSVTVLFCSGSPSWILVITWSGHHLSSSPPARHHLLTMRLRWTTLLSPLLALAGTSSSSSQTSWSNLGLLSSQASKRSVEDSHVRLVSSVCSLQW